MEFHKSLIKWNSRAISSTEGCIDLSDPVPWKKLLAIDLPPSSTPASVYLEMLKHNGFKIGKVKVHALPILDKQVEVTACVSRKSYLRCLLKHEDLHAAGLTTLPVHHYESFYKCVLDVDPLVDRHRKNDYYMKVLMDTVPDAEFAIDGPCADEMGAITDGSLLAIADGPASVPNDTHEFGEVTAAFRPIPPKPAPSADSSVAPKVRIGPPNGLPAASSGDAVHAVPQSEDTPIVTFEMAPPLKFSFGNFVENQRILFEEYEDHSHRYTRWNVRCPLGKCRHVELQCQPCNKSRCYGLAQTKHFGEAEVYGYLGVWLRKADTFNSRTSHMLFRPSLLEVKAYILEMGWPLK